MRAGRTLLWLERVGRLVVRLMPTHLRAAWGDEIEVTFADTCRAAYQQSGVRGLWMEAPKELADLATTAVRARLGRHAAVTAPGPRSPRDENRSRAHVLSKLRTDLRLAARALLASKTSTVVIVLTLALGIGVNAAVFSILDSTLFRPVPFPAADRLVELWTLDTRDGSATPRSRPGVILEWRRQTDLFDRVEGYEIDTLVYAGPRGAEMLTGAYVTAGLMSMLGVRPLAGRLLGDGDGRAGSPSVVVVSEEFWREALQRAPGAIGRTLTLDGRRHEIVGILPATFRFPNAFARIWLPDDPAMPAGPARPLTALARRAPGLSAEALAAAVDARAAAVVQAGGAPAGQSTKLTSSFTLVDQKLRRSLGILGGAVAFLLLIVCANLASLSLSRTLARARDLAVRVSIGASRGDLLRESLVEHLLVGAAGAFVGAGVAALVIDATLAMMPEGALIRSMNAIDLDARAVAFTAAAGLAAALLFGLPPAWLAARTPAADALKQQSRATTSSRTARRLRSALVVAEVSLAIVLLVGAALMARSFARLVSVDRGFDTTGLVTLRVGLPGAGFADPVARDAFIGRMIDRARLVEGVTAVTAGAVPPRSSLIRFGQVEVDHTPGEQTKPLIVPIYHVWPTYFQVVGIPILAGRPFSDREPRDSIVVSESFARAQFGSAGTAVGRRFRLGTGAWLTIVGVAGEVRQFDLDDAIGTYEFYTPMKQLAVTAERSVAPIDSIVEYRTVVARAADPTRAARLIREAVHDVDPRVVVWESAPLERAFADAVARPRLVLLLMTVFAAMGLVLAAAGIYGALSYLVTQRRREIGIRLALGARPASVGRLVLGTGLGLTATGVILGVGAALGLVRVMQSLLYEVEPSDPLSVAAVIVVLTSTAVAASWLPARRAMRVDPLALLREE